jgi:CsoR family transcriptional regulator, copper-sensing transcriptional repressor
MSNLRSPEKKKAICDRLARVEGQLRGVQKLIDSDADCEKIAQHKTFFSMVGCMIEEGDQPIEHVTQMLTKFA